MFSADVAINYSMPLYFTSNIIPVLSINIHFFCAFISICEMILHVVVFSVCYVLHFFIRVLFLLHWSLFTVFGMNFLLKILSCLWWCHSFFVTCCCTCVHVNVCVKVDYPNFRIIDVVWWIYVLECTSYQCVEIFLTVLVKHICTKLKILPVWL